jgi:hypothetical protein
MSLIFIFILHLILKSNNNLGANGDKNFFADFSFLIHLNSLNLIMG